MLHLPEHFTYLNTLLPKHVQVGYDALYVAFTYLN